MSISNKKIGSDKRVSLPVVFAVVVLLVAFVGWRFYAYFGPHTPVAESKPLLPQYQEANDWVTQKAKESQGDVTKLSPEDQQQLSEQTHGMGATVLKSVYEQSNH